MILALKQRYVLTTLKVMSDSLKKRPFSYFQKDNKYIRATLGQKEAEAFKRVVVKRLYELKEENKEKIQFSWG